MKIALDKRLRAVVSEISKGDKLADIGCDHGKIANLAVQITENIVYATDISEKSLKKAAFLANELKQSGKIICLCGDGLKPLADKDINTVVIAGMGGCEIVNILSEANKRYAKYILVPHQHPEILRKYLGIERYGLRKDYLVKCDNKFYPVIVADGNGESIYSEREILVGKCENEAQREYIDYRICILQKLLIKANGNRLEQINKELKLLKDNK